MRPPIYIRPLSAEEQEIVEAGLRSRDAFVLRRSQILLASARRERVPQIARSLSCDEQTVRNVIHAFNQSGLLVLEPQSTRPLHSYPAFDEGGIERLQALVHQSPRTFHKETSVWTLDLVAEVCFEQGITATLVTGETIRTTLKRLGIGWRRAKQWISSPDPAYERKKSDETA